jgi:hypothetical protein
VTCLLQYDIYLHTLTNQRAAEYYWSKDDWLMPFTGQKNIVVLVIVTGELLVFGGPSDMDDNWTTEESNLAKRWSLAMPQLKGVIMSYGYNNREGKMISRHDQSISGFEGRRAYMEKSSRGNWRKQWYDDSIFKLQCYPFGTPGF